MKKSMSEVEILWWNNDDTGQQEGCRVLIAGWNLIKAAFHLFLEMRVR
jgi:hypothetical protein